MRRMLLWGPAVVAVLLATGCTATTPDGGAGSATAPTTPGTPTTTPGTPTTTPGTPAPSPSRTLPSPTSLPSPTALPTPVTGEVPAALLGRIVADAAQRSGVAEVDIVVVRGESVTWSDGSLGCPQPGMSYTQALVPGYWVVLDAAGTEYDYRVSESGYFALCEGGGGPPLGSLDR